MQAFRARGVRDAVLELPAHVARVAAPPLLAVHAHAHLEPVRVADLVGGDEAWPHRIAVIEILALARAELPRHLRRLLVARREVVEDRIAEDVLARLFLRNVLAGSADVAAELELEVEPLGVRRPGDLGVRAAHREAARVVEERPLVPGLGWLLADRLERLQQVLFEAEEIAHLRRIGDRREQLHVGAVMRRGIARATDELISHVERFGARLHHGEHARQERRAAVVRPRIGCLQVEDPAIACEQLTEEEWFEGIKFLSAVGQKCDDKRQEFILLSDILGLSMMVVALNHRTPPGATEATVLGPFFVHGAPQFEYGADFTKGATVEGETTWVTGRVLSIDGKPIPNAALDIWQARANGVYDIQDPDAEFELRGRVLTNAEGRYAFKTYKPQFYGVPDDGPVGG